MGKFVDLTGQKFGRLIVEYRADDYISKNGRHRVRWHCRCDCGEECEVIADNLLRGHTLSCGCFCKEQTSNSHIKSNCYIDNGEYIVAKINGEVEFLLDSNDKWALDDYCWCITNDGYLRAYIRGENKFIFLHRLIMNCNDKNCDIDHINGNPLDNRKSNLRIVTRSQNNMNRKTQSNNTSGISGVCFNNHAKKWQAQIKINNINIYLGSFDNFSDAVSARKAAEEKYFGEYSFDNSREKTTEQSEVVS